MPRRLLPLVALLFAGCGSGGNVRLFGYDTTPPFDPAIKTVYVPVFKNAAFQTTPNRGLEVDITEAVVKEITGRTPMRVVSDPERADTELIGMLVKIEKRQLNRNQQNQTREGEMILTAHIVWRDLRTGRVLSNRRAALPTEPTPIPFDPTLAPPPTAPVRDNPYPVTVVAIGRFLQELGETNATANQSAAEAMAKQIVNMMEKPW